MPTLTLPAPLVRAVGLSDSSILVDGATVGDALRDACRRIPDLTRHLFHASGLFKDHFVVTVRGEVSVMASGVRADEEIELMLASSGGLDESGVLKREEVERYARHLTLPEVGRAGQLTLKRSRVLIVGVGGLGSPVALYLAAAGVGTIGLIDPDGVEASNLQRQIAHGIPTLGLPKVESARRRIADLNEYVHVDTYVEAVNAENAEARIGAYDLVIDGTDSFATRYLVNDVCVRLGKPLVHGAIHQFDGQVSVFNLAGGPCYRCLFPVPPPAELAPNCVAGGVIGVLPGVIGLLQATEAIKLLLGLGKPLSGRLLRFDALAMRFDEVKFGHRKDCPTCGHGNAPAAVEEAVCASAPSVAIPDDWRISPEDLLQKIVSADGDLQLLDVREPGELEICKLEGSLNIPLPMLSRRLAEIGSKREIVALCRSGPRADRAVQVLRAAGMVGAKSLSGGMLRWAREIDPSMAVY